MNRLFGTDGVRGRANVELTPELALALGRAAAEVLGGGRAARPRFVIGRDTRASGPMLEHALVAGLLSAGADVTLLGVVSTPGVAYLTPALGADAGIVISASHNPAEYNGIKIIDGTGRKLPDDVEDRIEAAMRRDARPGAASGPTAIGAVGRDEASVARYVDHLVATVDVPVGRRKVVLDCGHGAAVRTAPDAFRKLGVDVVVLNDRPDGWNINDGCGSQHPEGLARAVVEQGAFAGFAFDGDADRCIAVDERGQVIDGDGILAMLALDLKARGRLPGDTVVATVMSNLGLERALQKAGIRLLRTQVGDRYVLEGMLGCGSRLGGEQSGHVILLDHATTGDGVLTALQVLAVAVRRGRELSELAGVVERLPQAQRNVRIPGGTKPAPESYADAVRAAEARLAGRGRVVVRPSGTEPVVRILVEGEDAKEVETTAAFLENAIAEAAARTAVEE
ncbi:MAG: phosphoglucosamine mutase [Clostridia bacterium]|nr:phosphoglucosamine mutase [Clostridia bacterium]